MPPQMALTLKRWHEFVKAPGEEILSEMLADSVKFYSPFVWKPKDKRAAVQILTMAAAVFEDFNYVREMTGVNSCCLEFTARIGDVSAEGVDLIEFNEAGQITEFKVMIRPANALQTLGAEMGNRLRAKGFAI